MCLFFVFMNMYFGFGVCWGCAGFWEYFHENVLKD